MKTIYQVICLTQNGSYIYSAPFPTKKEAEEYIEKEKEDDKVRYPGYQYRYNIEPFVVFISD